MAVTLQAWGAIAASTGVDVTPAWPSHQADDIGIAHVFYRSQTPTTATPSGWTLLSGPYDGGASTRHYWFWKRAAGSSETNPLMDKDSATGDTYARVYTVRGAVATGNPFEDIEPSSFATSDLSVTGVTSLTAGALILALVGEADDAVSDWSVTATDPAVWADGDSQATSTTGSDATMGGSYANRTTAGATGSLAFNWQNNPDGGAILVMAIGETSSAPNGTLASTLQAALFSGTGAHTTATTGSLASILQAATFAASGALPNTGTVAATMQAATFSGNATHVAAPIPTPNSRYAPLVTVDALYRPLETIGARFAPIDESDALHA
jgi:hypothetical protein